LFNQHGPDEGALSASAAAPYVWSGERISYRIPTFDLDGKYLLYMAAFKDHVSIYPATASMMAKYGEQLKPYRSGAGTLRFDLGERLPLGLITKLAKLRVQERRAAGSQG
jgi:uncharacterized protein YdhG (YjbR/CyaY superfamily)